MFAMVFKCFSGVFASVSHICFKYFICLLLYIATVASRCFKSVAHRMRVGSGRLCGRLSGRHVPTAGVFPRKPDALLLVYYLCAVASGQTSGR
jgi:hypothetical protein